MQLKRFYLLWLVALIGLGSMARGQEPLTLAQAIHLALTQSPDAAVARADSADADEAAKLARIALLPQLRFTEDISRGDDPVYAFGAKLRERAFTQADFVPDALNRPQPVADFSTRFSGSWVAFDSFRTQKEIHRADLIRQSTASSVQTVDQQIVLRVVTAYQSILLAQRQLEVARHEQETAQALLDSVGDRVKAGLAVESDRMSALVDVAARKEDKIAALGALDLAWEELREAMGASDFKSPALQPIEAHAFPEMPLDQEIATAVRSRPDLAAMVQAQSAQATAIGAAKSDFGPRVSAYATWEEDRGSLSSSGGNNWVAGVQVTMDLLPAGKHAQLARETAAKQRIDAQLAGSQQRVRMEVNQAHIRRRTAKLSLETARDAMDQSAESLRILRNRYGAGLATISDVLRAEDAERQSQSSYWQAVYKNAMAYAELLFATGTLTPETAEELQ